MDIFIWKMKITDKFDLGIHYSDDIGRKYNSRKYEE